MKKPKKPRNRRDKVKYPALDKKYNPKIRQENIDADYLHLLSPEELAFYNRFMEEENNASFKNDGNDLNNTKEERKKIYDRNNARQRCIYSQLKSTSNHKANKKLVNYESIISEVENEFSMDGYAHQMEDAYIDFLDNKEIQDMIIEYDEAMLHFKDAE